MKLSRKKILVLASTFPRWKNDTTPSFVFELEKNLAKHFDITILAPHHNGAKKYEKMSGLRIKRFQYFWPDHLQQLCYEGGILPNLKQNKFLYIEALTLIITELIQAIKHVKKDPVAFIHAHWIIPQGIIAYLIKKITRTPYIITIHGGDIYGLQYAPVNFLRKLILTNAHSLIVASNAIKHELINKYHIQTSISVISMGVDPTMFTKKAHTQQIKDTYKITGPFLLFIGRLAEIKGVEYLIRALPLVIKIHPSTKLVIIGEGPLEKSLKALTSFLQVEKNVIFAGAISHTKLPPFYATADIFIGPSIKTKEGDVEGLGLTLIEACLSKCLVIASKSGGVLDIIINKKTGFLIPPKNSKAIAQTILHALINSANNQIRRNALHHCLKNFSVSKTVNFYTNLYNAL